MSQVPPADVPLSQVPESPDAARKGTRERSSFPTPSPRTGQPQLPGWDGPTYYGRAQLKPSPFNKWLVGTYIFLAGLSGSSSLLGALADLVAGPEGAGVVRRGRRLALLAPTIGSLLLIRDLHTPKRFYNMLRVAKPRSPMSIGTWILMAFSGGAFPSAFLGFLGDRVQGLGWLRPAARATHLSAAAAGSGLSVYTAALLSATSSPAWASTPKALAVRFGASSVASAASALMLGERSPGMRRALQTTALGALAVEVGASSVQARAHREMGIEAATLGRWGKAEKLLATGVGVAAPMALFAASLILDERRSPRAAGLARMAALATLAGSWALRTTTLGLGDESAARPEISLRYAQPENLPRPEEQG